MKPFLLLFIFFISISVLAQVPGQETLNYIDSLMSNSYKPEAPGAVVLAAVDGKPVFEKAYGLANVELNVPNKPEFLFAIGSMSKQFTAVSILKLAQEGKLSLNDDITKYLTGYNTHGRKITIENLLTHTSGITSYTEKADFMKEFILDKTKEEMRDYFMNDSLLFEPGTDWSYSNSGFLLAGMIVEKVSGESLYEFEEENIFKPAGMEHTYFGMRDSVIPGFVNGYDKIGNNKYKESSYFSWSWPFGAGQIISSAEDLLKWDEALYTNKIVDQKLLEKGWNSYKLFDGEKTNYGYGWGVGEYKGTKIIRHGGAINGYLSDGIRIPSKHIYTVILSNFTGFGPAEINQKIAFKLAGIQIDIPKIISLAPGELNEYTGVYEVHRSGSRITTNSSKEKVYRYLTVKDDTLYSQNTGSGKAAVFPTEKDLFVFDKSTTFLKFNRDDSGKIASLTIYSEPLGYGPNENEPKTSLPIPSERKEINLTAEQLQRYRGAYDFGSNFQLKIFIKEDKVFGQATGQPAVELFPESEKRFFLKVVDASIDFNFNDEGKITGLVLHQGGDYKAQKIE